MTEKEISLAVTQDHGDGCLSLLFAPTDGSAPAVHGRVAPEAHRAFVARAIERNDINELHNVTPAVVALQKHHVMLNREVALSHERQKALHALCETHANHLAKNLDVSLESVTEATIAAAQAIAKAHQEPIVHEHISALRERLLAEVMAEVQAYKVENLTAIQAAIQEELAGLRAEHAALVAKIEAAKKGT